MPKNDAVLGLKTVSLEFRGPKLEKMKDRSKWEILVYEFFV